jgi:hypothetical protein
MITSHNPQSPTIVRRSVAPRIRLTLQKRAPESLGSVVATTSWYSSCEIRVSTLPRFGLRLEQGPNFRLAEHRIQHQGADRLGDPRSPRSGALWEHAAWLLFGEANHSNQTTYSYSYR